MFLCYNLRKSSLKEREGDTLATWAGKSETPVEQTSPQKNSNGKSKGSLFYQPTDFNRSLASAGNRKLATCDSTTSHPAALQVTSSLESQSSSALWRSSPEKKKKKAADGEKESDEGTEEKPKKRSRSLQLAFLYDSLSKFFTASGSKRAAVQRSAQSSSGDAAAARWVSPVGSMSLRAATAAAPKAGYGDRWHSEERKREKFSRTSKSCEKSKSVQMKVKKVKKELCLKQRMKAADSLLFLVL